MDIISATEEMKKFIESFTDRLFPRNEGCDKMHLIAMCDAIINGDVQDDKANRWLGWLQGVCGASGFMTLEQMKAVNTNKLKFDIPVEPGYSETIERILIDYVKS